MSGMHLSSDFERRSLFSTFGGEVENKNPDQNN